MTLGQAEFIADVILTGFGLALLQHPGEAPPRLAKIVPPPPTAPTGARINKIHPEALRYLPHVAAISFIEHLDGANVFR